MLKIRTLACLTLIAFVLNAVLPFFAAYNGEHTARLAAVFGEKILICSGEGFKWVTLADLESGKEKPTPHSGMKCPLCYAAQHVGTLPEPLAIAEMDSHVTPSPALYTSLLVHLPPVTAPPVRAPPVSLLG